MELDHHHQDLPLEMTFTEEQKNSIWSQIELESDLEGWEIIGQPCFDQSGALLNDLYED